jgi:hypothetical protein
MHMSSIIYTYKKHALYFILFLRVINLFISKHGEQNNSLVVFI